MKSATWSGSGNLETLSASTSKIPSQVLPTTGPSHCCAPGKLLFLCTVVCVCSNVWKISKQSATYIPTSQIGSPLFCLGSSKLSRPDSTGRSVPNRATLRTFSFSHYASADSPTHPLSVDVTGSSSALESYVTPRRLFACKETSFIWASLHPRTLGACPVASTQTLLCPSLSRQSNFKPTGSPRVPRSSHANPLSEGINFSIQPSNLQPKTSN